MNSLTHNLDAAAERFRLARAELSAAEAEWTAARDAWKRETCPHPPARRRDVGQPAGGYLGYCLECQTVLREEPAAVCR